MSARDDESTLAHEIARIAVDLGLGGGNVGDLATVLGLLGVAKGDGSSDAGDSRGCGLLNGAVDHGRALAVASDDELGVGAL